MTRFRVRPRGPLEGTVRLAGATKNSGLKQMAAALLAPGVTTLRNMPPVRDLDVMIELLRETGAVVEQLGADVVRVDASGDITPEFLVAPATSTVPSSGPLGRTRKRVMSDHSRSAVPRNWVRRRILAAGAGNRRYLP